MSDKSTFTINAKGILPKPDHLRICKNQDVQHVVQEYLMGAFVCSSGGNVLYSFQVDRSINVDLMSQFIAALSMFGAENVGKIKRILIEGLNVEMNIVAKHDLIAAVFFRPNMVKDYLDQESIQALDMFYKQFKPDLEAGKTNQSLYTGFDEGMCVLIHDYLVRTKVLDEDELCIHREKYFPSHML